MTGISWVHIYNIPILKIKYLQHKIPDIHKPAVGYQPRYVVAITGRSAHKKAVPKLFRNGFTKYSWFKCKYLISRILLKCIVSGKCILRNREPPQVFRF